MVSKMYGILVPFESNIYSIKFMVESNVTMCVIESVLYTIKYAKSTYGSVFLTDDVEEFINLEDSTKNENIPFSLFKYSEKYICILYNSDVKYKGNNVILVSLFKKNDKIIDLFKLNKEWFVANKLDNVNNNVLSVIKLDKNVLLKSIYDFIIV